MALLHIHRFVEQTLSINLINVTNWMLTQQIGFSYSSFLGARHSEKTTFLLYCIHINLDLELLSSPGPCLTNIELVFNLENNKGFNHFTSIFEQLVKWIGIVMWQPTLNTFKHNTSFIKNWTWLSIVRHVCSPTKLCKRF